MSIDPVLRLVALHSDDVEDAIEILFPRGLMVFHTGENAIDAAASALMEIVEDAICRGIEEVHLDLQTAELIALGLKRPKRRRGRPPKSIRGRTLRDATLRWAEHRSALLCEGGYRIGEARALAAVEASERAAKNGDYVSPSTIERQMKEVAAKRNSSRKRRI